MLSAVNSSVSFGKSRQDSINEIQAKKLSNTKSRFGAQAGILLGYSAGVSAINKYAMGKSFGWNKAINNGVVDFAKKTSNFISTKLIKDTTNPNFTKILNKAGDVVNTAAKKIAKTSGRQKLIAGATLLAAGAFVKVSEHFAKKQGMLDADLKKI